MCENEEVQFIMGRLLTAGFESGLLEQELMADTSPSYQDVGSPIVQTSKVKEGSYALKVASGGNVEVTFADYNGPYFFKFWFLRISVAAHTNRVIWRADAGGFGFHALLLLDSAGNIVERHNNSVSGEVIGTAVLADDTWYEIRIEYYGANAPNGYVKVWVDKVLDIDDTSIDTQRSVGTQGVFIFAGSQTSYDFYYDNIFINDDQGADNNTHIDDGTTLAYFLPIADGIFSDFVPYASPPTGDPNHYTYVDEIPYNLSPGLGDSLDGRSVDDVELLVVSNVSSVVPVGADIKNINILTATWVEAGSTMRALLRVGGSNYNGPANLANLGANVGVHSNRWLTNPDTTITWVTAEIDDIEIGAIITASTGDDGELHAIGLYVEYLPLPEQVYFNSKLGYAVGNRVFPIPSTKLDVVSDNVRTWPEVYP